MQAASLTLRAGAPPLTACSAHTPQEGAEARSGLTLDWETGSHTQGSAAVLGEGQGLGKPSRTENSAPTP